MHSVSNLVRTYNGSMLKEFILHAYVVILMSCIGQCNELFQLGFHHNRLPVYFWNTDNVFLKMLMTQLLEMIYIMSTKPFYFTQVIDLIYEMQACLSVQHDEYN